MSDEKETQAEERDEDETTDRDSDGDAESEREPAPRAAAKAGSSRSVKESRPAATANPGGVPSARVGLFVVVALLAGAAAGWFGHVAQAKAALRADSTAPSSSSSGACGSWQQKICSSSGDQSAACQQAKGATELLTPLTCEAGLLAMPATLSKLKAARAGCDKLVSKLCADLPAGSQTCAMVKERTPAFPAQRCDEMLTHYDEVIGQLRQMDQQQGAMHMGGPGGPGGPGPVMPPH